MPEAIPSILAPYLEECLNDASLSLVTSTLSTPPTWLLTRLLYLALSRFDSTDHALVSSQTVVFVSLLRPSSQWLELGKRIALDLALLSKKGRLRYIDGLAPNAQFTSGPRLQSTALKSLRLDDIAATVQAQLADLATTVQASDAFKTRGVVFIDGLDFVLASQPDADVLKVQQFVSSLRIQASAVILTCSADSPLLHNRHDGATPLERGHSGMVTSLAHQSSWALQLRGLDSGAAKDVTGVLRISRGGAYDENESTGILEDGEWLYQLKGDGSARVWSRGQ